MNRTEFEQFVLNSGKDILRFCRMTAGSTECGDELYQDTMLKLLEKKHILDPMQNIKSYALSTAIFLWKNKQKKYAARHKLAKIESLEERMESKKTVPERKTVSSPEQILIQEEEIRQIQEIVVELPEEYRIILYLYYSADMKISEISQILNLPEGTVKTRMRKAKQLLKKELEDMGYDR